MYTKRIARFKLTGKQWVGLILGLAVIVAGSLMAYVLSLQAIPSGCSKSFKVGAEVSFTTECINDISSAAKAATLQTGATQEVANAAGVAAAEAAGKTFESGTLPSVAAQEIALDTIEVVNEEAMAQGQNATEATRTATAAGAAAAITVLGAPSSDAAEFVATLANTSSSETT
jgi:hypothetical protein